MLIGLHGPSGSGKDESYGHLREWTESTGQPVRRDAFADLLKLSAAWALGYQGDRAQCVAICNQIKQPGWEIVVREPHGIEHSITGRQFLQYYGIEAHRDVFGEDFWINPVLSSYSPAHPELLVVTDVRLPNEAEAIHAHGGEVWKLNRPGERSDPHSSEAPLAPEHIDRVIDNTRGLKKLRKRIRHAIKSTSTNHDRTPDAAHH